MPIRRCSGLSTKNSPPRLQNAWPPSDCSGSWSSSRTRLPASATSAAAARPARPAPTTMTSLVSALVLTGAILARPGRRCDAGYPSVTTSGQRKRSGVSAVSLRDTVWAHLSGKAPPCPPPPDRTAARGTTYAVGRRPLAGRPLLARRRARRLRPRRDGRGDPDAQQVRRPRLHRRLPHHRVHRRPGRRRHRRGADRPGHRPVRAPPDADRLHRVVLGASPSRSPSRRTSTPSSRCGCSPASASAPACRSR